ncbi:WhiB family transcriptional regulator [Streptomyces bobili]|uniref:WhiB family transcriptional regulator n=1 Tax=Streptomyces bobili TaxID=67280 RepID=UPI0037A373F1
MTRFAYNVLDAPRSSDWRDLAACRDEDPELFFPKGSEGPWILTIEQAKAVCQSCPVADACRAFALNTRPSHGIFGGLTQQERANAQRAANRKRQPRAARTFRSVFDESTAPAEEHLLWTGSVQVGFHGRAYTPRQVAFIADRGRQPVGRVLTTCGMDGCVLPTHIGDDLERAAKAAA